MSISILKTIKNSGMEVLKNCEILPTCSIGLCLICSKLLPIILLEFPKNFTYYFFVLSLFQISLKRYSCIRNTSFKIVKSNEVESLVLSANCKQGTIRLLY